MKVNFLIGGCIFIMKNKYAKKLLLTTAITIAMSLVGSTEVTLAEPNQQDFSRLSCSQLDYLATKYERIAESAASLARTATSGVVSTASSYQAQQANQMADNLRMIAQRKGC